VWTIAYGHSIDENANISIDIDSDVKIDSQKKPEKVGDEVRRFESDDHFCI
jgi:hypothetical protein